MSIKKYSFYVLFVSICFFIDPSVSHAQALKIQHDLVVAKDGSGDCVKWAHQLTDKEVETYTIENILLEN